MNKKFFVNQKSINDCGIACLVMILNIFDKKVSFNEIKNKISISNEGVSAYDIIKILDKYGIKAVGYKNCNIDEIKTPAIIHTINSNNTQHFMILIKVFKDKVLVADPASNIRYIKMKEFNKLYTKIAITINNKVNDISFKREKLLAAKIISLTLVLSFLTLFSSLLFTNILKIILNNSINKIIFSIFFFFLISFLREVISFIRQRTTLKFETDIDFKITINTLKKLISLPHTFYHQNGTGELLSKVNDLSYIKEMIYTVTEELSVDIIFIIFILIFLFIINRWLFLASILVILIISLIERKFFKTHFSNMYDIQIKNEILNGKIGDCINGILTIKNLGKENFFKKSFTKYYESYLNDNKSLIKAYQNKIFFINLIVLIFKISTLIFLFFKKIIIYKAIFIVSISDALIDSVLKIFKLQSLYANSKSALARLKSLEENEISNSFNKIKINNIMFKNFNYYVDNKKLFKDVNLSINKHEWVLVYGKTGIGKSTMFKLLTKQIQYNGKGIYINKNSINKYTYEDIRKSITYVDQKNRLFNNTIYENIYFNKVNNDSKIERFLKLENIDKNLVIDNECSNISGGQMQKIIIAQTLLNSGDVIIFDETTNQIDVESEKIIFEYIKNEYKNKTIILISHRKENLSFFDKIVYFENKKIKVKSKEDL